MDVNEFVGLQAYYNKRKDADIMLLDDKINNLQQQIFGFKGRSQKAGFSLEGMFKKLLGSVVQLGKISTEVLILSGLGDASHSEAMEDIRKQAKTQRLSEKAMKPKKGHATPETGLKPHRKPYNQRKQGRHT